MGRFHARMDDDLRIRGDSANTRASDLRGVRHVGRHFMRPPDQLTPEHIRQYPRYLTRDRRVSWSYVNQIVGAWRFFSRQVLKTDGAVEPLPYQRTARRLPEILSPQEGAALFRALPTLKQRALRMTMYAGGLRVSEVDPSPCHRHRWPAHGSRRAVSAMVDARAWIRVLLSLSLAFLASGCVRAKPHPCRCSWPRIRPHAPDGVPRAAPPVGDLPAARRCPSRQGRPPWQCPPRHLPLANLAGGRRGRGRLHRAVRSSSTCRAHSPFEEGVCSMGSDFPAELVYERRELRSRFTGHRSRPPRLPRTVRACFNLGGQPRVTQWGLLAPSRRGSAVTPSPDPAIPSLGYTDSEPRASRRGVFVDQVSPGACTTNATPGDFNARCPTGQPTPRAD